MDTNANLNEQRELANELLNGEFDNDYLAKASRLAELVEALDQWLTKGGALPPSWGVRESSNLKGARIAFRQAAAAIRGSISGDGC